MSYYVHIPFMFMGLINSECFCTATKSHNSIALWAGRLQIVYILRESASRIEECNNNYGRLFSHCSLSCLCIHAYSMGKWSANCANPEQPISIHLLQVCFRESENWFLWVIVIDVYTALLIKFIKINPCVKAKKYKKCNCRLMLLIYIDA